MEGQIENQDRRGFFKKFPFVPVLFIVGAVLAYPGWYHHKVNARSINAAINSPAAPWSAAYFKTHFQTEGQFIVESILTDVAEMAWFAKTHTPPKAGEISVAADETADSQFDVPKYAVTISTPKGEVKTTLIVNGMMWSADVYTNATAAIFKQLNLSAPKLSVPAVPDTKMLKELLYLTGGNIELQNQNLSEALGHDFMNPVLHEQAAALMAAFALRDSSGDFFDIRSPLNRVTAHLVMARMLANGSKFGPNGTVAEAVVCSCANDQKNALAKAAALDPKVPELAAWSRAIYAHTTLDYRPLAAITSRSTLEDIAYFQAYCFSVNSDQAWAKMSNRQKALSPDLCRFAQSQRYSVGLGHVLSQMSLALELKELRDVYSMSQGQTLSNRQAIAALNAVPDRCFSLDAKKYERVRIIGWGQWAYFCQRHLCQAMQKNYDFYARLWGVKEEADKFSTACNDAFSELRLYPFVRRFNCIDERNYHRSVDDGLRETQERPDLTPATCWNYMCYPVDFAPPYKPNPNPHINEFHNHDPLPGTVYDLEGCLHHRSLVERQDYSSRTAMLHNLAPYNEEAGWIFIRQTYHRQATFEQEKAAWASILDFNVHVMYGVATRTLTNNSAAYEALLQKTAAIDPGYYFSLGEYFAERHNDPKTILYLQKGMDLNHDAVAAANYGRTLMKCYLRAGNMEKAGEIADFAAEVYSYSGLLAKAEFLEAKGDYNGALDYYKKIEERYERPLFHLRTVFQPGG